MQQQQQPGSYDLLAVFPDEPKAEAATAKLRKEGFSDEEVFQLPSDVAENGQFREHGPNIARRDTFLQVQRSGPNPVLVAVLAVVFGLILGLVAFAASFPFKLPEPATLIIGSLVGIVIGIIVGLLRRGRVRGAIGQDMSRLSPPPSKAPKGALTVVALRLSDAENISRMSRARAMLINSGGKIDRSVNRQE
jgi:hypothetical protein